MRRFSLGAAVLLPLVVVLSLSAAGAVSAKPAPVTAASAAKDRTPPQRAAQKRGPGFLDRRLSNTVAPTPAVAQAQAELRSALGRDGLVQVDPHTGTPRAVLKLDGFLTEPSDAAPTRIALDFVRAHLDAFGLSSSDMARLKLVKNYTDVGGTHHLAWAQVQGGIPAFDSELAASVTKDGRLVNVLGSPVPGLGVRSTTVKVDARAAVNSALKNLGARPTQAAVRSQSASATRRTVFSDGNSAQLVIFGSPGGSRLAWQVRAQASPTEDYLYVVDAKSGGVLWRDNMVDFVGPGGNVWEYSPSATDCNGGCAQRHVAFPSDWTTDSSTLSGEFAHAYLDTVNDNTPDPGDEVVPGDYTFVNFNDFSNPFSLPGFNCSATFPCSWTSYDFDSWQTNANQTTVQLYYYVSQFHDHLLAAPIGFTEAAGNFEQTNESGQGAGGDPVQAQSDDGIALGSPTLSNANMTTYPDGTPPRMQMYIFYGGDMGPSAPDANGADDGSIVYHEYTHGLSNRLVSVGADNTPALNTWQSIAMGEGWSDWYSIDYLTNQGYSGDTATEGDVKVGYFISGGSTIRYEATDCPTDSVVSDCQPPGWVAHSGGYTYGDFAHIYSGDGGLTTGPEEHADGEIWAQTLWEMRQQLGSNVAETVITRAMELSPPNPSFLDMRNAIIQADTVNEGGADHATLWDIFAGRGMGYFASTTDGMDLAPVEDFTTEADALALPSGTLSGTVTDTDTGTGVSGATVGIENHNTGSENLVASTGVSGDYTIGSIPAHTYPLLSVSKTGYDGPAPAPVTISGGSTTTRDFTIRRDWASVLAGSTVTGFTGPDYSIYGCGPDQAFDQSLDSGWGSNAGSSQTITLQLPQDVDLALSGGLQVDPGATCGDADSASLAQYTIQTSPNGTSWTTASSGTFTSGDNHHLNALTVAPAAAYGVRYVRLTMISNQGDPDFMDLSEIVVYGTPVSATCSYSGVSHTLTVPLTTGGATATIRRFGDAIRINGSLCGSSTVNNTDTITVTGGAGDQSLVVDLSGGALGPGLTVEGSGTSEIEINADLGAGTDSVRVVGSSSADDLRAGGSGVNLNGDNDADLTLVGADSLQLEGVGGADTLYAAGGFGTGTAYASAITLFGGDGNDALYGGNGNDQLFGGPGDDVFTELATTGGDDDFTGGAGTDTVSYALRAGDVSVTTADGIANDGAAGEADFVKSDIEVVLGGGGDDHLSGGTGADVLVGGAGNDVLSGAGGADTLTGGAGDDTVYAGDGNDTIDEGSAASGADVISGGNGTDTVSYAGRSSNVSVAVQDGLAQDGESGEGDLVRADVENVSGGSGNDMLVGSNLANVIDGGAGNDAIYTGDSADTLVGGAGNDALYAGPGDDLFDEGSAASGADTMAGAAGSDTVSYALRTNAVSVSLADGLAQDGESGEGDLVRVDVENVSGGSGADTLVGSSVANVLSGGAGNDQLFGGAGDDTLTGGAGSDTLNGADGVDTFHAQDGVADSLNGGAGTDVMADYDAGIDTVVSIP